MSITYFLKSVEELIGVLQLNATDLCNPCSVQTGIHYLGPWASFTSKIKYLTPKFIFIIDRKWRGDSCVNPLQLLGSWQP